MKTPWFRLWCDMVNDPKWRTISRISGQKIGDVISTYLHMLTLAANATERGRTEGWNDEDVATALDIQTDQVAAIREAMQGRVIDNDYLLGWEKRQPMKEDGAAGRAKAWREAKKAEKEREQTLANAAERNQTQSNAREEKRREEVNTYTASPPEPKFSALQYLVGNGVDKKIARDWLATRKAKNLAPTETAIVEALKKMSDAGLSCADGVRICVVHGWGGFNSKWLASDEKPPSQQSHMPDI